MVIHPFVPAVCVFFWMSGKKRLQSHDAWE